MRRTRVSRVMPALLTSTDTCRPSTSECGPEGPRSPRHRLFAYRRKQSRRDQTGAADARRRLAMDGSGTFTRIQQGGA